MSRKMKRILLAKKHYKQAAEELIAATKEEFPMGLRLVIRLGNAIVDGEVTGYSDSWWNDPGTVYIKNLRTGKTRHFAGPTLTEARES